MNCRSVGTTRRRVALPEEEEGENRAQDGAGARGRGGSPCRLIVLNICSIWDV